MERTTTLAVHEKRPLSYRAAVFGFGVLAYALGVFAFAVLIAAMLGVLPFTGGPIGPLSLGPALAFDLSLLVAFALQHSVMARPAFKRRFTRVVPVSIERSSYLLGTAV